MFAILTVRCRPGVRVVDLEPGLGDRVEVVDRGALQVGQAERVDDDRDAVQLDRVVAVLAPVVEAERVLEAGAAAALDGDAQHRHLVGGVLGEQVADLRRGSLGQRDVLGGLDDLHGCPFDRQNVWEF